MPTNRGAISSPAPSELQRLPQPQNSIALLIETVKKLKLNEVPEIARCVRNIAIKENQMAARKLVRRLAQAYYDQQLSPNHFISMDRRLEGEFVIGITEDGRPFGLDRTELNRHVAFFGQSGSGKTTALIALFVQAAAKKLHCVFIDRKGDLDHLARQGIDVVHWSDLRENPLCPPDCQVSIDEWRNDLVKATSELMKFLERGSSVCLDGVDQLYQAFSVYENWGNWDWRTRPFPTLSDLLDLLRGNEFGQRIKGQGKESLFGIIEKLQALLIALGPILRCQRGFDVASLYRERRAISYNLDGLPFEYQNFLIAMLLLRYAHFFKTFGPRNELNVCLMFDEAKGLVGKANQNSLLISDLVSKVREWGIGLVCADQIPSEISQFFFSNIGSLIMFRCSDGNDLQRLRYSSGASIEQALANYSLKPGQAIVRAMKSKDLHKITVPFELVEKFISRDEVRRLMAPRVAELHQGVIPISGQKPDQGEKVETRESELDPEERRFLEGLAKDFNRPSSEIYRELGLIPSAGFRLKKKLLAKHYISEVETNLGKDGKRAVYLVPNTLALAMLGIHLNPGRGGSLHRYFQAELKAQAERLGFEATVEPILGENSEAPDLALKKDSLNIAVEISVTSKPRTESLNVEKNLTFGFTNVILTFVNRDSLEQTQRLCAARYSPEISAKVRLCLVSGFANVLAGLR